jgi:hypothetical protein
MQLDRLHHINISSDSEGKTGVTHAYKLSYTRTQYELNLHRKKERTTYNLITLFQQEQSRAEQKLTAGNQPARSLLTSGPGGTRGHIFVGCRDHYGVFFSCGAPSLTSGRV